MLAGVNLVHVACTFQWVLRYIYKDQQSASLPKAGREEGEGCGKDAHA